MRRRGRWMNAGCDPVLEILRDAESVGLRLSRDNVLKNINLKLKGPPSKSTVYRSFDLLEEHGFIESDSQELFSITEPGKQYLAGEIDASDY